MRESVRGRADIVTTIESGLVVVLVSPLQLSKEELVVAVAVRVSGVP